VQRYWRRLEFGICGLGRFIGLYFGIFRVIGLEDENKIRLGI
jgi:hypothetical protein